MGIQKTSSVQFNNIPENIAWAKIQYGAENFCDEIILQTLYQGQNIVLYVAHATSVYNDTHLISVKDI